MKPASAPTTANGRAASPPAVLPRKSLPRQGELKPPATLMEAIIAAASDPSLDISRCEQLIKLHGTLEAQANERAFNEALAEAQAQMAPISKDATNPQTSSRYATLAQLDRALRPIYSTRGFAVTFDTEPAPTEQTVRVVGYLSGHGHTRRYQLDMPADGKGPKGGDVQSRTHAVASAVSYGRRYILCMAWNISTEDDDGNAAGGKAQSSAALKRSGVWADFERDMRGARSLKALEAVCTRWRPRMASWSPGYRTAAVELKGQQIERLGGTLAQLEETAAELDEERGERLYEAWRRP